MAETKTQRQGPLVIDVEGPATGALADLSDQPDLLARRATTKTGGRGLWRWFLGTLLSLLLFLAGLWAWDFGWGLLQSRPILGAIAMGLLGLVALTGLVLLWQEFRALARLRRLDRIRQGAMAAVLAEDLPGARAATEEIASLYRGRTDLAWAVARFAERQGQELDAGTLVTLAERELLAPLDAEARRIVEQAARQVAVVTAVVPLALADVAVALFANVRMLRRIAELYGGRAGLLGSWRLMRAVMLHLAATGAMAVGDDLIHSLAGGGLLSKLSRRFGEGVVNGALTARVGIAAMEMCRPLPFDSLPKPRVSNLLQRGLTGLFGSGGKDAGPKG
ncbi:MAG: TIGR01620 family protein [Paracoccaceae bacterium]